MGVLKFSPLQSISVAAASNPTTAGRKPSNTFRTTSVLIYFINIFDINIIKMNEGNTNEKVAVAEPSIAIGMP
jgi:hypothetical protein